MEITIYSTSTCSACHVLTAWLDKQHITYTKKITDEDTAAMVEFMSVNDGMVGVPFTLIKKGSTVVAKIAGFDQKQFKSVLNLS